MAIEMSTVMCLWLAGRWNVNRHVFVTGRPLKCEPSCVCDWQAIQRIVERNQLSEEQAAQRLDSQLSNKERIARSNVVICPLWEFDYTRKQVVIGSVCQCHCQGWFVMLFLFIPMDTWLQFQDVCSNGALVFATVLFIFFICVLLYFLCGLVEFWSCCFFSFFLSLFFFLVWCWLPAWFCSGNSWVKLEHIL